MSNNETVESLQSKLNNALGNIMVLLENQQNTHEEYQALMAENNELIEENEKLKEIIEELIPYKEIANNLMKLHLDSIDE